MANADIQLIQFLIIMALMILSFVLEIVSMEVTALGAIGLLLVFDIITIDDAISGFDVDSEIKLYDALGDIAVGRTVIIVSNRLWHLRLCNKIFVVLLSSYTTQHVCNTFA